ncbi:hypothetical protein [Chryseobacterium sp. SN22]|uniref:hypothetical protein n=1 Tax=Chryseobacterium sp. SN22 TaxID=2606431 RepID=UPI001E5171E1|nr:hypothetical protein [Chryseobacterium sp. SN22]
MIKLIYLVGLLLSCNILSQTTGNRTVTVTLPEVTLMDVEPAGTISLNYTAPPEAGNAVAVPTANTTKWINYTSAITAFVVQKELPLRSTRLYREPISESRQLQLQEPAEVF